MSLELFCLSLLPVLSLFVFAISGFGPVIMFQIGYFSLIAVGVFPNGGITTSLVYLSFSMVPVACYQAIKNRKYIILQPKLSGIMWFGTLLGAILGTEILSRWDNYLLVRLLGCLLLVSFFATATKDYIYPRCKAVGSPPFIFLFEKLEYSQRCVRIV